MMNDYDYFAKKKYKIVYKLFDEYDEDCDYDEVVVACQQATELKLKHLVLTEKRIEFKTHKLVILSKKIHAISTMEKIFNINKTLRSSSIF